MASTTTFSPDSVHGGPVIATLCGTFKKYEEQEDEERFR